MISDAHSGIKAARKAVMPSVPWRAISTAQSLTKLSTLTCSYLASTTKYSILGDDGTLVKILTNYFYLNLKEFLFWRFIL
jgi:hypothetical protein